MSMITPEDLADWLRLMSTEGVGDLTAQKLLAALGLPHQIFKQSHTTLAQLTNDKIARALRAEPSDSFKRQLETTLAWLEHPENHVVTLDSPQYPQHLLTTSDPPMMLYVKGRLDLLNEHPAVAIVGSRNATTQGINNAEQFAQELAQGGLTVISGMALGIDAAAHRGAMTARNPNASTIAVIGTGCDIIYPARNRDLAHRIVQEGVMVSEFPLGFKALPNNFPRRNRIISGLSRGVLVVEAALQSGSLITARQAAEQNREVFAIPGSIHSPVAKGCHSLIRQGAKLVESAQDILEELHITPPLYAAPKNTAQSNQSNTHTPQTDAAVASKKQQKNPTDTTTQAPSEMKPDNSTQELILAQLGFDPCDLDTLAARTQLPIAQLSGELMLLELAGWVEKRVGNIYARLS